MLVYNLTGALFALSNIALRRLKISRYHDLNDPFELLGVNLANPNHRKLSPISLRIEPTTAVSFSKPSICSIPMFETDCSVSKRKRRAIELLTLVGLEARLHHFPAKLSGGERQRVSIARSLANGASVLLADEPTGNLDSENSDMVLDLIVRLRHEQNFALVLVTHDMGIARKAGRVISMKDGRIVSDELNEIWHPKMT